MPPLDNTVHQTAVEIFHILLVSTTQL